MLRLRALRIIIGIFLAGVVATAASVEAGSVSVSWNAPTTNADGSPLTDLASYRLYLATSTPTCPGGSYLSVASPTAAPTAGQTVASRVSSLTAGTTYFVRITAVDTAGNESACSPSATGVAQANITVTPSTITSFGTVATGTTVDRTFTVQNTSTASVSGAASIGSPYSIVTGSPYTLAPGASQTVTVRFSPTTVGTFAANVTFTANGDTVSRSVSGSATSSGTTVTLSVTTNGTGTGTVSSVPAGISCGATCTQSVTPGTQMTLSAVTASGSTFAGWGGACTGTGTCVVTVNAATSVSATFNATATGQAPGAPGNPSVTQVGADAASVTFAVAWSAGSGAASYQWTAAFNDGSAAQQGSVTALSFQLRMPYHASGAAFGGFVCIRSVSAAGVPSVDQACNAISVPARPAAPPAPTATGLSPATAAAGSPGSTLTVNGSGFVSTSVVRWNGNARPTTLVSPTQLQAAIASTDLATAGSVPVTVFTPAPGGGTSAAQTFTVTAATAASIPAAPTNPTITQVGADATGVTFNVAWSAVSGAASYRYTAGFTDGTAAQQGTVTGLTSFQLRMPYHISKLATGAFVCLRSVNSAGQLSTNQTCGAMTVPAASAAAPVPVASSLSPASAVSGSTGLTLTVNGSGFVRSSVVRWNGLARTTTFVSASQLRAAISAADLARAATIPVSVFTPAPGGGVSAIRYFTVATSSAPPGAPGTPQVTMYNTDATGIPFAITWSPGSGATSYRYVAAYNDGSARQQGTVTTPYLLLHMPYYSIDVAMGAYVCVVSVNSAGQQSAQSCSELPIPVRGSAG